MLAARGACRRTHSQTHKQQQQQATLISCWAKAKRCATQPRGIGLLSGPRGAQTIFPPPLILLSPKHLCNIFEDIHSLTGRSCARAELFLIFLIILIILITFFISSQCLSESRRLSGFILFIYFFGRCLLCFSWLGAAALNARLLWHNWPTRPTGKHALSARSRSPFPA